MKKFRLYSSLITALLLVGVVDVIDGNNITIEYEEGGKLMHSTVPLDLSICTPAEGQKVFFYKDYKVVSCEGDE